MIYDYLLTYLLTFKEHPAADWVCHIGTLTPCIEAVAWSCIIVIWWSGPDGGIQALSARPIGFLQCFDTVGLVI